MMVTMEPAAAWKAATREPAAKHACLAASQGARAVAGQAYTLNMSALGLLMNWSSWLAKVPAMKEPRNTVMTCSVYWGEGTTVGQLERAPLVTSAHRAAALHSLASRSTVGGRTAGFMRTAEGNQQLLVQSIENERSASDNAAAADLENEVAADEAQVHLGGGYHARPLQVQTEENRKGGWPKRWCEACAAAPAGLAPDCRLLGERSP